MPVRRGTRGPLHALACTHNALVGLRRRVLEVTEKCVRQWVALPVAELHMPPPHVGYKHHTVNPDTTARRVAEVRQQEPNKGKRTPSDDGEANWLTMTKTQRLLISLGPGSMWLAAMRAVCTHCSRVDILLGRRRNHMCRHQWGRTMNSRRVATLREPRGSLNQL